MNWDIFYRVSLLTYTVFQSGQMKGNGSKGGGGV